MKTKPTRAPSPKASDEDIRDYAYHLYVQSGCRPDADVDNWLEAEACIAANIPREHSHSRLHRHLNVPADVAATAAIDAKHMTA